MDDGSEFTVYFLKDKNKPNLLNSPQYDTLLERMEKEEKSPLVQWFWGKLKIKNYE